MSMAGADPGMFDWGGSKFWFRKDALLDYDKIHVEYELFPETLNDDDSGPLEMMSQVNQRLIIRLLETIFMSLDLTG